MFYISYIAFLWNCAYKLISFKIELISIILSVEKVIIILDFENIVQLDCYHQRSNQISPNKAAAFLALLNLSFSKSKDTSSFSL